MWLAAKIKNINEAAKKYLLKERLLRRSDTDSLLNIKNHLSCFQDGDILKKLLNYITKRRL